MYRNANGELSVKPAFERVEVFDQNNDPLPGWIIVHNIKRECWTYPMQLKAAYWRVYALVADLAVDLALQMSYVKDEQELKNLDRRMNMVHLVREAIVPFYQDTFGEEPERNATLY